MDIRKFVHDWLLASNAYEMTYIILPVDEDQRVTCFNDNNFKG